MIKEIHAKKLLSTTKSPQAWFNVKYNMNIYRGCEHQCIYCDSRSECYGIENFNDVLVKINAVELLAKELAGKRVKGIIGTGAMSDPYTKAESKYNLTGKTLEMIAQHGFPIHIITKSNLIIKDIDTLKDINRIHASVAFTVTTTDDELGKKLEPGASLISERLKAMESLACAGIYTGITMMPILPFIGDTEHNVIGIVERAAQCGAKYIVPWFGMSLRDRQRAYYYSRLDSLFPGVRERYQRKFGNQYSCSANNAEQLKYMFNEACSKYGIITKMSETKNYTYKAPEGDQLSLI
ncbi:MAG: radical SAM protein [Clostridia bacterium]|nr:radical SAM protein [Clostridia bacterium]